MSGNNGKKDPQELPILERIQDWPAEERRRTVSRLRRRGLTIQAIAAATNQTPAGVEADLETIRQTNAKKLSDLDSAEHIGAAVSSLDELEEQAWAEYHSHPAGSKERLKALTELRAIQSDRFKALKETGYIRAAPKKLSIDVDIEHHNSLAESWTPDLIARVSQALLQQALTPQLPEAIPEAEILDPDECSEPTILEPLNATDPDPDKN